MAFQSQAAKRASGTRRPAPAWLRLGAVCVLLIVVPVAVYLFLYQRSRVEQATIRNFRTLDAAAERVAAVLDRLTSVVSSFSFGADPLQRKPLSPSRQHCPNSISTAKWGVSLRERLPSSRCSATVRSPRLTAPANGIATTVVDICALSQVDSTRIVVVRGAGQNRLGVMDWCEETSRDRGTHLALGGKENEQ